MAERVYELEELVNRPGTYFNPQTEVMVVVDDSSSLDSEIFNMEEFEGAEWVLVSDELPVDEPQRDELLESFQATYHGGDGRQVGEEAVEDADDVEPEPDDALVEESRVGACGPVYYLGIFIPAAVVLELAHASPVLVFSAAALGVIPTAAVMGEATEHLAAQTGPGIGGFLNVTFGNAPELIIAFFALKEGLQEVVKASIVGSVIGNLLLVLGAAMLVGGLPREKQTFNATAAERAVGDAVPGARRADPAGALPAHPRRRAARRSATSGSTSARTSRSCRSAWRSCCSVSYAAGLVFSLKTHRSVFNPYDEEQGEHARGAGRSAARWCCSGSRPCSWA